MKGPNDDQLTDKELVSKTLRDPQAFALIIKNTEKLVAQIVFKMIPHNEDRKDLAQEIYLKAYKKLSTFQFESKLSTWIAQISYNTCIDYLRKNKLLLLGEISGNNETAENMANLLQHHYREAGTDTAHLKNISVIVRKAIEKLSPVYKTLITLYHNEELSYDEISRVTGLPAGTVKSYLFRARKELKNNLSMHYKKEDLC